MLNPTKIELILSKIHDLSSACVLVNFGKDYVYFGQKLVAEPTSHDPHEPHFLLFKILFLLYYIINRAELNGNRLKVNVFAVLVDRQK
jgi:hypothetical protein